MRISKISNDRLCARWLLLCAAMVFMMAVIGAVTRLTESGLSITTWKPVTGALPPLSHADWMREFADYRHSPEFIRKNAGMSLEDFKHIFFWEWLHRLWGRLIGLVFAIPLFVFWLRGRVADGYGLKCAGLLALGGLQGIVGWWMVKSGLVDNPAVSHYRLATHLGLAVTLYALMIWMALTLLRRDGALRMAPAPARPGLRRHGWAALALLAATMIWGAFTAGLDAGLIYNEWPFMGRHFVPTDMWAARPAWMSVLETHAAVQFTHRWLAFTTLAAIAALAWRLRARVLAVAVACQFSLGLATLLSGVMLPLAALHQAGALLTLAALLYQLHRITYGVPRI